MLTATLFVGIATASSDATVAKQAQAALDRATRADGPGAAVLIAIGTDVVFRRARGRAHIELGVPLSPDHVFEIASVTKMFTAATILKLAQAGKLSLDDSLASYLPDFPSASMITMRQLLSHTAGISDRAKDPQPGFGRRDLDLVTRLGEIQKRSLDFPPGTGWHYSNSGFLLLGAVIEKVTGEPWHVALQKMLLEPLRLERTQYGAHAPIIPGRAAGYTTDGQTRLVSNAEFISMTTPASAGALVSTVDDLLVWIRALATGRVISPKNFQDMITPTTNLPGASTAYGYGYGTYIWRVRGATMIGHTGQIDGFASAVGYLPERDITVIVLANDDNFDARTMGRRLAAMALGEPYAGVVAVPASDEELRALEGTYRVNENTLRTLSVRNGQLYSQRGSGNVIPLQMTASKQLHFVPDELSYFMPVKDAGGKVTRLDYFENGEGPPIPLPRIQP